MISSNLPKSRHHGAPKHGDALLAGPIRYRCCGRKLTLRYSGMKHHIPRAPGWTTARRIAFGDLRVDDAIEEALASSDPASSQRPRPRQPKPLIKGIKFAKRSGVISKRPVKPPIAPSGNLTRLIRQTARLPRSLRPAESLACPHCGGWRCKIAAHDAATAPIAIDPALLSVLASNLEAAWSGPTTDARLKKRIVRTPGQLGHANH
ncbi:hypothetical protein FBZ93_12264 [Bradyrhizobium macuxiense]|uniref:Uncharacterized protein n=1 Tax=Bradyrhizobium macuxiense TaxID=1755647 RepID=A0A560KVM5_9BRAD|nr:hypothetical protein [Bradyrhizobium macuxiense]TWB87283.1 hypothetical protein FBZ93_12264 [Bradyrhizobium macuxiense]